MTRSYVTPAKKIARPAARDALAAPAQRSRPARPHSSAPLTVQRVLALQRSVGNQAACEILNGPDAPHARRRMREGGQPRLQREPTNEAFDAVTKDVEDPPDTERGVQAYVASSVQRHSQLAFIVNAILPASDVDQIPAVVASILAGLSSHARARVAIVLGVNARESNADALKKALARCRELIEDHEISSVPIGIVPVTFKGTKFPYGTVRNAVLHSDETRALTAAFIHRGLHPYVSFQDFDTGSRRVADEETGEEGEHIFEYLERTTASDEPEIPPERPLMMTGGYRIGDRDELIEETAKRQVQDVEVEKKKQAKKQERERKRKLKALKAKPKDEGEDEVEQEPTTTKRRAKTPPSGAPSRKKPKTEAQPKPPPTFEELYDRFHLAIERDMQARKHFAGLHPLLPYAPEPNLFVDAIVPIVDATVRFGPAGAEFTAFAKAINRRYATELETWYRGFLEEEESADSGEESDDSPRARNLDLRARLEMDAQTLRHPVRGRAFLTDFVGGRIATDLSRIALDFVKSRGKTPLQSHDKLTDIVDRAFFDTDKSIKKGVSFANVRDTAVKRPLDHRHPLTPRRFPRRDMSQPYEPVDGPPPWAPDNTTKASLGGTKKLSDAIFSPFGLEGPFAGMGVGVSGEHQLAFGFGASLAQPTERMMQTIIAMLTFEPVPEKEELPPNCFHSFAGRASGRSGAAVRQLVIAWLADPGNVRMLRTLAEHMVNTRADHIALCLSLRGDGGPSVDPGSLAQRVVASALGANIRVTTGSASVTVSPLGRSIKKTLDAAPIAVASSSSSSSSSGPSNAMQEDEESGPWGTAALVEILSQTEPDWDPAGFRDLVKRQRQNLGDVLPALLGVLDDQRCLLNAIAAAGDIHVTIEHVMALWLSVGHDIDEMNAADWVTLRAICRVLGVSGVVVLDEHYRRVARWGRTPGAAVIRRLGTRYLPETELAAEQEKLNDLLHDNNCLLNAIAESKGLTLTFEQIVEIRMRLGSIGTMLVASPQTLKIICEVLGIDGVRVHYPYPAPPEDWGSGEDPAIISHTGFLHFVAGAAQPGASTKKKESKGKGKERL